MKRIFIVLAIVAFGFWACSKKNDATLSENIKIISLTSTLNPIMAYDTTVITVKATGENLQYGWVANHGRIKGSGKSVRYSACITCIGHNTITCRVFNDTGEVSDTIMIRVTPWHTKK